MNISYTPAHEIARAGAPKDHTSSFLFHYNGLDYYATDDGWVGGGGACHNTMFQGFLSSGG